MDSSGAVWPTKYSFLGQSSTRVYILPSQHYTSCNPRGTALALLLALTLTLTDSNFS